jgi:hypothetical protein
MGEAQIAQYLSAGVAGAPQRGQIMFTLLVQTGRGPTGYDCRNAGGSVFAAPAGRSETAVDGGSIPWALGRGSRRK